MSKKLLLIILATHIGAIGVGVYGGMRYCQSKSQAVRQSFQNTNMSAEERQQMLQQFRGQGSGFRGTGSGGGAVSGEIISRDDKSITVKLHDARLPDGQGGSRIVFYSGETRITKPVDGTAQDLEPAKQVVVNGAVNADGSMTAESIQIRPPAVTP